MIIFLYGKDEFRSREKLAEIKNKFLEKNKEGASLFVFDFAEKDWNLGEIITDVSSGGLFSSKKLAIVKNILTGKKEFSDEGLENFLKNESKQEKSDLIVVFWESGDLKKSSKFYKLLKKIAKCQEFEFLEGAKLKNWIAEEIKKIGEDKGEITSGDVENLVKSKVDTDIFKTVDALARGDKKTALRLLHEHIESGEDPFYLLSMYFYQFRNLVKVKPLAEKNSSPQEIASKLKMHPFVVRKSLEQTRNFSWLKLKNLYNQLCEIDFASKSGKTDIELALDKFVAGV